LQGVIERLCVMVIGSIEVDALDACRDPIHKPTYLFLGTQTARFYRALPLRSDLGGGR
jgi:hypothetical protein